MSATPSDPVAPAALERSEATEGVTSRWRFWLSVVLGVIAAVGVGVGFDDVRLARGSAIAVFVLSLWLLEATAAFVPTLVLAAVTPVVLGGLPGIDGGPRAFALGAVLGWGIEPVVALFFGGFVLGAAAQGTGLDRSLAGLFVHLARGSVARLVVVMAVGAAFLSMWMSNVAAAALLISTVGPLLEGVDDRARRAVLVALAMGANVGGMATPVGTGPNAIAMASLPGVTFAQWMLLGVPLTLVSIVVVLVAIRVTLRPTGVLPPPTEAPPLSPGARRLLVVMGVTITGWLLEPVHGVGSATVAIAAAAVLFLSGIVDGQTLRRLDWSTLLVVMGGIALGRLLEQCGVLAALLPALAPLAGGWLGVAAVVFGAALLSALMSNTATATVLIPIAATLTGHQHAAVVVAMACSLGALFVVSTPQNAMVAGRGVSARDLMLVGLPLLVVVGGLVALTGPTVVSFILPPWLSVLSPRAPHGAGPWC